LKTTKALEEGMLRLPKNTVKHPLVGTIEAAFTKKIAPLRPQGTALVSYWSLDDSLSQALKEAGIAAGFVQGLDQVERLLDKEAKGILLLRQKTGQPEVSRLSRLLFLSNDGSERFYRKVETILKAHGTRTWAVVLDINAEALGKLTLPLGTPVKALLLADRKALELFLASLGSDKGKQVQKDDKGEDFLTADDSLE
jgi:hypothetical protein